MLRSAILLGVASTLAAVVNGDPSPHMPGSPDPGGWMTADDDNWFPDQPDDRYTAGLAAGARIGDYVVGFAYALYTHKTSQYYDDDGWKQFNGTRADEVTLTVGRQWQRSAWTLEVAAGARRTSDLGGQAMQDVDHARTHNIEFHFPYDPPATRPIIISTVSHDTRWQGCGLLPSVTASTTGDAVEMEARLPLYLQAQACTVWVGPVWYHAMGHQVGVSTAWVHREYSDINGGVMLSAGMTLRYVHLIATGNRRTGYAGVGVNF